MGEISKKVQERRLKWYGHVTRRDEEYVRKRVMRLDVDVRRRLRETEAEVDGQCEC